MPIKRGNIHVEPLSGTSPIFTNACKKLALSALTAARAIFERTTREQPDYAQAWTYLGLTDAMLGRRDDAIREGKRACEVLPFSKDSWIGAIWRLAAKSTALSALLDDASATMACAS
jgi:tetratricopeptide (TPR) repeat protein